MGLTGLKNETKAKKQTGLFKQVWKMITRENVMIAITPHRDGVGVLLADDRVDLVPLKEVKPQVKTFGIIKLILIPSPLDHIHVASAHVTWRGYTRCS